MTIVMKKCISFVYDFSYNPLGDVDQLLFFFLSALKVSFNERL